jgi:integrase/recombinase XerC
MTGGGMTRGTGQVVEFRLADGGSLPAAEEALFEEMLAGWEAQRLSRNLSFATVESGGRVVRRLADATGAPPWRWSPESFESWVAGLRERDQLARSTVRSYGRIIASFLAYVCDPAYDWSKACLERFGTHPVQICRLENLAAHTIDVEAAPSRRPLTKLECQALFDAADDRAVAARSRGIKGWAPAVRDAVMLKTAYAFGLRRHELVMLERADFTPNPKASEFGSFGVCNVRFGKSANGSPPRRRGVLCVMDWSVEVLDEWVEEVLPAWRPDTGSLWPSERGERLGDHRFQTVFAVAAQAAGLPAGLSPHCLRHSYVIYGGPETMRHLRAA